MFGDVDGREVTGEPHDGTDLLHHNLGGLLGALRAVLEHLPYGVWLVLQFLTALLDGLDDSEDRTSAELLTFIAADGCVEAAGANMRVDIGLGEDPMQVPDGTDVGVAWVLLRGPLSAVGHSVGLAENDGQTVGEIDGIAIAFGHLTTVGAGQFG